MAEQSPGDDLSAPLHECAVDALAHWDLDVRSLEFVALRENAVFRGGLVDGRAVAVRIHRPGYHTTAELESEDRKSTRLNSSHRT